MKHDGGPDRPGELAWFVVMVAGCAVLAFLAGWGLPG